MEESAFTFEEFSVELGSFEMKGVKKFDRLYRLESGGSITSDIVYYNGLVYFSSANFNVYAVRPEDGKLVWKFRTEGPIMESTPVIKDGILYVGRVGTIMVAA